MRGWERREGGDAERKEREEVGGEGELYTY